jgi:hypothetical protein
MFIFCQDRAAGVTGLTACLDSVIRRPQLPLTGWISMMVLPILGFGLMTIRPRRPLEPERVLVLIQAPVISRP